MKRVLACLLAAVLLINTSFSGLEVFADTVSDQAVAEGQSGQEEPFLEEPVPEPTAIPLPEATPEPTPVPTPEPTAAPTEAPAVTPEPEAADVPAPTETPVPSSTPVPEANRSIRETMNFELEASTSLDSTGGTLLSGDSYNYYLKYTVPPLESGKAFTDISISIEFPEHVSPILNSQGRPMLEGDDVSYSMFMKIGGKPTLTIVLNPKLTAGKGKTISIPIKTDNNYITSGMQVNLDPKLKAQAGGENAAGEIEESKRPVTTVTADDDLTVKKETVKKTEDSDYYYVDYKITVSSKKLATADGSGDDYDRMGRLNAESYTLTDILPTDTPEGGRAVEVSNVKMDGKALDAYELQYDGDRNVVAFTTQKYVKAGDTGKALNYVGAESLATTVYSFTAKYPKAAYRTPSNEPLVTYTVHNSSKINYRLLGQGDQEKTSVSPVEFKEHEVAGDRYSFTVQKKFKLGDTTFDYSASGALTAGAVRFTLYKDEACTTIATDVTGQIAAGATQDVNSKGQVSFKDLRGGTYYLKEEVIPALGIAAGAVVKVALDKNGITPEGAPVGDVGKDSFDYINPAGNLGGLSFVKYGTDAAGKTALLKDCTFSLTDKNGTAYTATSDGSGKVSFLFIPAGIYTLRETAVGSDDYPLSGKTFEVTVKAGEIAAPALDAVQYNGAKNGFLNVSERGIFSFTKVDSETRTGLPGAEFQVYGPYDVTQPDLPADAKPLEIGGTVYTLTTGASGIAESVPLQPGQYFLRETKAPNGYSLSDAVSSVTVKPNSVTDPTRLVIENQKKLAFHVWKVGVTSDGAQTYEVPLEGVEFELYDKEGNRIVTDEPLVTAMDQGGKAVTPSVALDRGTYYLKETKTAPGYILPDKEIEITIPLMSGGSIINELRVENYTDMGRIRVMKTDGANASKKLEGAVFGIYSSAACIESDKLDTVTTGADGTAVSGLLPKETYYLKELKAPAGYAPTESVFQIEVDENEVAVLTIENTALVGAELVKLDSISKNPLSGARFGLFFDSAATKPVKDGSGKNYEATTNASGKASFTNLDPQKAYWVKELAAPTGYVKNETVYPLNLQGGTVSLPVENDRQATLKLHKTAQMTEGGKTDTFVLQGVTFALYHYVADNTDYSKEKPAANLTTDKNGNASKSGLTPGEYWLKELSTGEAEGVYAPLGKKITLAPGQNQSGYVQGTEEIKNETLTGKIRIKKLGTGAPGTAQVPLKASFGIYNDLDCIAPVQFLGETKDAVVTTGSDGTGLSGWLKPGTYYLKETAVADGYTMDGTVYTVIVEAGVTNTEKFNDPVLNKEKGRINLSKKASFTIAGTGDKIDYDLNGSVFALYNKISANAAADIAKQTAPAATVDLRNKASGLSDLLDAGEYWLAETEFPAGYTMAPEDGTQLIINGKVAYLYKEAVTIQSGVVGSDVKNTVTIHNVTEKGRLRIIKKAFDTNGVLLDGARFQVYKLDPINGTPTLVDTKDGQQPLMLTQVNVSSSTGAGDSFLETGTVDGKPGQALSVDIEAGTYYIQETDTTKIKGGTWYWYHQWSGPIVVDEGKEAQQEFYNYTMQGSGTKTGHGGAKLPGAVFGVFETEADAKGMQAFIKGQNIGLLNANYDKLSSADKKTVDDYKVNLKDAVFLSTHKVLQAAESDKNGLFTFNGLTPKKTYYVLELYAPSPYMISEQVHTVAVNDDGNGFTKPLTADNQWYGRIQVKKVTSLGSEKVTVQGMEFKVYLAVPGESAGQTTYEGDGQRYHKGKEVATGKTDNKGSYTTIYLEPGVYIIEESSAAGTNPPVEINADFAETYQVVTVEADKVNTDRDANNPFFNPATEGKFLLKKTTDPTNYSQNVTFLLEQKQAGGGFKPVSAAGTQGKFLVKANGDQYLSPWLPAGSYRLTEVAGAGLTLDTVPVEFEIVGGQVTGSQNGDKTPLVGGSKPIVFMNDRQGNLKIQKQGAFGAAPNYSDLANLSGVQFALYKKTSDNAESDCGNSVNLVSTKTTAGANGEATWNNLDAGNYWLKEISLGSSAPYYEMSGAIQAITVKKGEDTLLTGNNSIKNLTTYGKLSLKKADMNDPNKLLSGAVFGVYTDETCQIPAKQMDGKNASVITGANGQGISGLLPAGSYYLRETTAPTGYLLSDQVFGPYLVEKNKTAAVDAAFTNAKLFALVITKTVTGSTAKPDGVTVALYGSEADAQNDANRIGTQTTSGGTGELRFTGLTAGGTGETTYYFREISVPAGMALNPAVHPVTVRYGEHMNDAAVKAVLNNDMLGKLQLRKTGTWQGAAEHAPQTVYLEGAVFALYPVSGDGVSHGEGDQPAEILTTASDGTAVSGSLAAGWYELVETAAPEGYARLTGSLWAEVRNNETNTTFFRTPIENSANKGRFYFEKHDGGNNRVGDQQNAVFSLEKKNAAGTWEKVPGKDIAVPVEGYSSGIVEPGDYRLTEIIPPKQSIDGGVVEFQPDTAPYEFTVTAGKTTRVNGDGVIHNSPRGAIMLNKLGKPNYAAGDTQPLDGANFALYTDEGGMKGALIAGSERVTSGGQCSWESLAPGTYWVQELESDAVKDQGYGISPEPVKVTVKANMLITDVLTETLTVTNLPNQGKLLIKKTDENGKPLNGAVFRIYAKKNGVFDMTAPVDEVTVSAGQNYSRLLPAADTGTEYLAVEVKAPAGYTLDEAVGPLSQAVTLYPIHMPGATDTKNTLSFKNYKQGSQVGFPERIAKMVSDDNEGPAAEVNADDSLLKADYTASFQVGGYADGKNILGAERFEVTDNDIRMEYYDSQTADYRALPAKEKDYDITALRISAAKNKDEGQTVIADIYYQSFADKAAGTFRLLREGVALSSGAALDLSGIADYVAGIKLVYKNVGPGFTTDGFAFDACFPNRGEESTVQDHEVRRIVNSAGLSWTDQGRDENGNITGDAQNSITNLKSNNVYILVPPYENKLPQISIENAIVNPKTKYYSGDSISYEITATNHDVENQEESLRRPVVSFVMPALTTLDTGKYANGFLVYKVGADGRQTVIPMGDYNLTSTRVKAPIGDNGGDDYVYSDKILTDQYVFAFSDHIVLEEGESIVIDFQGIIDYTPKEEVTKLVMPAYLSSTAHVPVSAENPKGLSFKSYNSKQDEHENPVIDGEVGDDLNYLNHTNTADVLNSTSISLVKSIGYEDENGNIVYVPLGSKVSVNAAEKVYYKLTVINNSSEFIDTARLVDVFPTKGDSYVLPNAGTFTGRGTNIPSGDGFEPMELLSVSGQQDNLSVYSTTGGWAQRQNGETAKNGILGSMYYRNVSFGDSWTAGWSSDSTAIAMEVDFGEAGLAPSGQYEIYLSMRTPGYTADHISDYMGKVMNNSAALAVLRKGLTTESISVNDRVEPDKVVAEVKLPTGSIGDFVWYDANNNGIQDAEEKPAEGVKASLIKTTYSLNIDGNTISSQRTVGTTLTNQEGWYSFTGLPCQYLKPGAEEGSKNPGDYVGSEYYDYKVHFEIPEGYTAAKRYAGDSGTDSNIDSFGNTEPITLKVEKVGTTLKGQNDMTVDAGLVRPFGLGDYVWLDRNSNGIQDADEKGVAGVPVFLYKVEGPAGTVGEGDSYLARTETDANGRYEFVNLVAGYYVVEFDVSGLKKPDGYTFSYDFTKTTDHVEALSTDSDAAIPVDADGRIMRTETIPLNEETAAAAGLTDRFDPRWDAGLVVYSAIGGFCFDDQDYNDIHTLNIPLPGTLVALYEVKNGKRGETPVASATVGLDGRYYFDHLVFSGETQDYQIRFVYPEGYTGVDGNVGGDNTVDSDALYQPGSDRTEGWTEIITLKKDTVDTTWDAGARKYGAIGDYVWNDTDKNGRQDEGETPVSGVRVVLQSRTPGGDWAYLAETETDGEGLYLFTGLKGGQHYPIEYQVVFALGETTRVTVCQQNGVGEAENSDAIGTYVKDVIPGGEDGVTGGYVTRAITLGYGQTDLTWDAGIVKLLSAVGNYVWLDSDYNGIQDNENAGVGNVPVAIEYCPSGKVEDPTAWKYYASTVTDSQGKYLFEGLEEGYYRVRFQIPDGYTVTKYDQTGNLELDSDAVIRSENRWFYTRSFFLPAGITDLSWDAGIYKPKVREEVVPKYENKTTTKTTVKKSGTTGTGRNVRTGDSSNVGDLAVTLLLSGGAIVFLWRRKKKGG